MLNRFFVIAVFVGCISVLCFAQQKKGGLSGDLVIFHAGSLAVPMKEIAAEFKKLHPDVNLLLETAGSVECARKITDLKKPCDIMASADYQVIDKMLIPRFADWNIRFIANEMCIVYTAKSRYQDKIDNKNWFEILLKKDVAYSRSDPNADPCGYRSVMTMQLAEKYYKKPGLAKMLMAKDQNYMRPKEVDLVALLEIEALDYIFIYKSVAVQHHLKYLELPDEINLKNPAYSTFYQQASVDINGKQPDQKETMRGEAMLYGITMLKDATHKQAATAFLQFLLSKDKGMKILERNGQPSVIPMTSQNYEMIPAELKPLIKKK